MSDTRVVSATGLLREFNELGVLGQAEVHVATRVGALAGEVDERVLLAVALAVRAVRNGSVVLNLHEAVKLVTAENVAVLPWPDLKEWREAVAASCLIGGPLRREGELLWLEAYWRQEVFVADDLLSRAARPVVLDQVRLAEALARLWPGSGPNDQRLAAAVCALSSVSVLGGGPGTGKTRTVARLLTVLQEAHVGPPLRVAVAAPTGKAAARLTELLADSGLPQVSALEASTLHRLLGAGRRGFWFHAGNRLPYDVVVVDEASMVSLSLFASLLEALRPDARLVLVGDAAQLASVEAGAVLADLVADASGSRTADRLAALQVVVPHDALGDVVPVAPGARLRDGVATLVTNHRTVNPVLDHLAKAIREIEAARVLELLRSGAQGLAFHEVADDAVIPPALLRPTAVAQLHSVVEAARAGHGPEALIALGTHRVMCAHRSGKRGVSWWSEQIRTWLLQDLTLAPRRDGRYAGQPLLVTSNDRDNKLWNGDTGVVLARGDDLVAFFGEGREIPLSRLGDVRPLYAMTVHRGQGSQFGAVTVILPPVSSPLGTRETLYTAVTRAEKEVVVIGSEASVVHCVEHRVQRASGLQRRLADGQQLR